MNPVHDERGRVTTGPAWHPAASSGKVAAGGDHSGGQGNRDHGHRQYHRRQRNLQRGHTTPLVPSSTDLGSRSQPPPAAHASTLTPIRPEDHPSVLVAGGSSPLPSMSGMGDGWAAPPPPQLTIPRSLGPASAPGVGVVQAATGLPGSGISTHGYVHHIPPAVVPGGPAYPPSYPHHPYAPTPQHTAACSHPSPKSTGHRIASHMHDLAQVSPFGSPSQPHPPVPMGVGASPYYSPSHAQVAPNHAYPYPGPYGWPGGTGSPSPMAQYASPPPPAAFLAHQHNLHRSPASPSQRGSPRSAAVRSSPRGGARASPSTPPPSAGQSHVGRTSGSGRGTSKGNHSGSGRRFLQQHQPLHQQLGPPIPFRLPDPDHVPRAVAPSTALGPSPHPHPTLSPPMPSRQPGAVPKHALPPKPSPLSPSPVSLVPHSPTSLPTSIASSPTSPTPIAAAKGDLPRLGSTPVSVARRLAQRQKQIDYGKNTLGYQNYVAAIPKTKRKRSDPVTPDKDAECSARSWAAQIKKWRRDLHQWDHSAIGGPDSSPVTAEPAQPSLGPQSAADTASDNDSDVSAESPSPSPRPNSPTPSGRRPRRQAPLARPAAIIPPPPLSSSPPTDDRNPSPVSPSLMHSWPRHTSPPPRASASSSTSSPPPRSETAWSVADSIAESWGTEQEEAVRRVLSLSQAVAAAGDVEAPPRPSRARGVVFQDDPRAASPSDDDSGPSSDAAAAAAAASASVAAGDLAAQPPPVPSDDLPPYWTPQGYMHYYPPFMLSSSIAGGLPLFRRPRRASDASTTSHGTARSAVSGGRAAAAAAGRMGGGGGAGTEYSVSDSEMSVRDDIYAAEYEWSWER